MLGGRSNSTASGGHGRMNLLLSYAGWQQDDRWVDRLPRLLEPMGVRSVVAPSGRAATRVIETTPIHVAVVDLGLPMDDAQPGGSEAGAKLLELLSRHANRPPTVVIKRTRTSRDEAAELSAALRAGAFAVLDRPRGDGDLELLLNVLRRLLERHYAGRWPGGVA